MRLLFAIAALTLTLGCNLVVRVDDLDGHACDEKGGCLPGYQCITGECVEVDLGIVSCTEACAEDQKCDLRSGTCSDLCAASVCPTGQGCSPGSPCEPIERGIGKTCSVDADCADALATCTGDATNPATVDCVCLTPATGGPGVCLGITHRTNDCEACGAAECVDLPTSGTGASTFCVPGGMRPCSGDAACQDVDQDPGAQSHCTAFQWAQSPTPGIPGLVRACASPTADASIPVGSGCEPLEPQACPTGLCVPTSGGSHVCTTACTDDDGCAGISSGRCLAAALELTAAGDLGDVGQVCGLGPRLGAPCTEAQTDCGTDAPYCEARPDDNEDVCTRPCADDADCDPAAGFTCRPGEGFCF